MLFGFRHCLKHRNNRGDLAIFIGQLPGMDIDKEMVRA